MQFYAQSGTDIYCELCFRHCKIPLGKTGFCGVQENRNGSLHTTVSNRPSVLYVDPIEKKPLYHFLPGTEILSIGTVGCNLRCPFCQNCALSFEKVPSLRKVKTEEIFRLVEKSSTPSIAFTYNEPTMFWPWAREISIEAKKRGIKTVFVSNGEMSEIVANDMVGKIDAVNIDIKSSSDQQYREILKGNIETVFRNIEIMLNGGVWVELTTLIVPDFNDSREQFLKLARRVKSEFGTSIPWHISAFHPAALYKNRHSTPSKKIIELVDIAEATGITYCYSGNISEEISTKCNNCGKVLIQRKRYNTENFGVTPKGVCTSCGSPIEGVFK